MVAGLELVPLRRVVGEPRSEFGGGSEVLGPFVDREIVFADAAGPEAVDEDAMTFGEGRVVGSVEVDEHL